MHIDPSVFGWQLAGFSGLFSTTDHTNTVKTDIQYAVFAKFRCLLNIITFQQYCVYIMM